jgi:Coenzyme PQQ synthesis protein D (PqqD)
MTSTKSELRSLVTPDGAMILDIVSDELTTLNATGGYVWGRLREGKSVGEIISDLARDTGQDPSDVADDVHEFVEQLTAKNLVTL